MSMRIFRSAASESSLSVPRSTALDDRLSYAARGLLLDILSRPDGWEANADELSQAARLARGESIGEGRRAMRALLAELEAIGYIRRTRRRMTNGSFFTQLDVSDVPNGWEGQTPVERIPLPVFGQAEVVYVIGNQARGVVKIGTTSSLAARLRQVQTGSPYELSVLWSFGGDARLESHLHDRFADRQMVGEWFDFAEVDSVNAVQTCTEEYYRVPPGTCTSWS
jgi:hypothetical protein